MSTAEILKELREERGISQMKMSQMTGISHSTIARWELGQCEPTASGLITLANFFDVSVDDLLCLTSQQGILNDVRVERPEILELYDELTPEQQKNLLNFARGMVVSNALNSEPATTKQKRA
ncbi:helix-turn-helix domain-containing protein [uncultured Clostridium sp.]|uniref:helix-turn-helix domain-containing protein n=1 Tax=uncultured Clostridium sp. TaxID=59620 RepID=UPI002634C6D3|nr:helix-turn-helix domain-containing protein [uncultured Clostridium sp.]